MTGGPSSLAGYLREADRRALAASGVRLALLLLAVALAAANGDLGRTAGWLIGLAALAGLGFPAQRLPVALSVPLVVTEMAVAALGVLSTGGSDSSLFVYLPAAAFAAGVQIGSIVPIITTGAAAAVLLGGRIADVDLGPDFTVQAAEWTVLALVTGTIGTAIGGLLKRTTADMGGGERYAEAYRLLAQLRAVTEGLPGSLDPGTAATTLLQRCIATSGADRGAVFLRFGGNRLVPMAVHGFRRVPWRPSLTAPGPMRRLWESSEPLIEHRDPDERGRRRGSTLVGLAIQTGERRIGAILLDWQSEAPFDRTLLEPLHHEVREAALQLETAILFDELRVFAANEERQRLAREMHDGIAQDLAYLGYELDALTGVLRRGDVDAGLAQSKQLRSALTELVSQLRLSISDLRSSVGPARGLGAALSEYTRSLGTNTGVTVNLSLSEGSTRLPAEVETELLRIAHGALGAARRRPGVTTLSVTLVTDPPAATLVIEDDGETAAYRDEKIAERASNIGAALDISAREPMGTRVSVVVGGGEA